MPPKKKLAAIIKLQIQAGAANPAPPVGPALDFVRGSGLGLPVPPLLQPAHTHPTAHRTIRNLPNDVRRTDVC